MPHKNPAKRQAKKKGAPAKALLPALDRQEEMLRMVRTDDGLIDFTRIEPPGSFRVYVPAVSYPEGRFRIMREYLLRALQTAFKEARQKVQKVQKKEVLIVFAVDVNPLGIDSYGVRLDILEAVAKNADDDVIEFQLDYNLAYVYLTHGRSKTMLKINNELNIQIVTKPDTKWKRTEKINIKARVILDFHNPPEEKVPLDKWIALAVGKDDRKIYSHRFHYGTFGVDGFRLHYDDSKPFVYPDENQQTKEATEQYLGNVLTILDEARRIKPAIHLPPAPLLDAVMLVGKTTKWEKMYIEVTEEVIKVWAQAADSSTAVTNIREFVFEGERRVMAVDPKYLRDALKGMTGDVLTLRYDNNRMYLTDGSKREAVVMQMVP